MKPKQISFQYEQSSSGLLLTLFALIFSLNLTGQDTASLKHNLSRRERKAQDKFINKNLVGKRKDQNSIVSFFANNRYLLEFDDGVVQRVLGKLKRVN